MTAGRLRMLTVLTGAALLSTYLFVFLPGAFFRFDDFWQLNTSVVHAPGFPGLLTSANEADGRWNPGMRLTLWLIGRVAGVEKPWLFYLALVAVHATNIALAVRLARLLGADARGRWVTALVGIAALNLTLYSVMSIFLLHGVLAMTCALLAVIAAVQYGLDRRWPRLVACAAATWVGLLCKEYAVAAPLMAVAAIFAISPMRRPDVRLWAAVVAAFAAGGLAFAGAQILLELPLVPASGRYSSLDGPNALRTFATIVMHVAAWLVVPLVMAWRRLPRARAVRLSAVAVALALGPTLPLLMLSWLSPGHLYMVFPGTAAGAGVLLTASAPSSRLWYAWLAGALAVVIASGAVLARYQPLQWGPITQQVFDDWKSLREPGDERVIWFDGENAAPYGGFARLIGPGIRLREGLEMLTGEEIPDAAVCIDVVVGPAYVFQEGDALFFHRDGRLTRIDAPPFRATCLP